MSDTDCTKVAHPYLDTDPASEDFGQVKFRGRVDPAGVSGPLDIFCAPTVRAVRFSIRLVDPGCPPFTRPSHEAWFNHFWPDGRSRMLANRCGDIPEPILEVLFYVDNVYTGGLPWATPCWTLFDLGTQPPEESPLGRGPSLGDCRYYYGVGRSVQYPPPGIGSNHNTQIQRMEYGMLSFYAISGNIVPPGDNNRLHFEWYAANWIFSGTPRYEIRFETDLSDPTRDVVPPGFVLPYEHVIATASIRTRDETGEAKSIYRDTFVLRIEEFINVPISGQCCGSSHWNDINPLVRCYHLDEDSCLDPDIIQDGQVGSVQVYCPNPPSCIAQGACCMVNPDATTFCEERPYYNCPGLFQGIGTTCEDPTICPPLGGPCCYSGNFCDMTFPELCRTGHPLGDQGLWLGTGNTCTGLDPPCDLLGRCCVPEILPAGGATSSCCGANGIPFTPGCDDPTCEAAVCALMPQCCDNWDLDCVLFAIQTACVEFCSLTEPLVTDNIIDCLNVDEPTCDELSGNWNGSYWCFDPPNLSGGGGCGGLNLDAICGIKCCLVGIAPFCAQAVDYDGCYEAGGFPICDDELCGTGDSDFECGIPGCCCYGSPVCKCYEIVLGGWCIPEPGSNVPFQFIAYPCTCADCNPDPACQQGLGADWPIDRSIAGRQQTIDNPYMWSPL